MPEAKARIGTVAMISKWLSATIAIQLASHFYTHNFKSTGVVIFVMLLIILICGIWLVKIDGKKIYAE